MVWWGGRSWKGGGSGRGGACGGVAGDVGVVGLGSVADDARVLLTRSHSVEGSGPCLDVGVFVLIRAFLPKCVIHFIYTAGSPTGTPPSPVALPGPPCLYCHLEAVLIILLRQRRAHCLVVVPERRIDADHRSSRREPCHDHLDASDPVLHDQFIVCASE
jgi:hypothetical protein